MSKSKFLCVTAPGLPTYPRLWFDPERKRAYVIARLATWRSYERAIRTTMLLRWTLNGLLVWTLWARLPFRDAPIAQGFFTFVGFGFFAMLTKAVLHPTLDGFWARQLYSIRTTFWFTPDAIAFHSPLYENGILLWRTWRDQPVQGRFDLSPDLEAASLKMSANSKVAPNPNLQTAHVLRLLIASHDTQQTTQKISHPQLIRAIPVAEIDLRDAQQLTIVLTAASAITAPQPDLSRAQSFGLDLDTVVSR